MAVVTYTQYKEDAADEIIGSTQTSFKQPVQSSYNREATEDVYRAGANVGTMLSLEKVKTPNSKSKLKRKCKMQEKGQSYKQGKLPISESSTVIGN